MYKFYYHINRPEYWFQPCQIIKKILSSIKNKKNQSVQLPWGLQINTSQNIGDTVIKAINTYGLYDLSLTEVLWRLIEPEDVVLDIGANIGYTASIAMKRLENSGELYCFEPNPEVYDELTKNLNLWQKNCQCSLFPKNIGLSNESKEGILNVPLRNRGEAFISHQEQISDDTTKTFTVKMQKLDDLIEQDFKIGIIKLDVEGYELQVLQGASHLLEQKNIRDIIFEEHREYPTPVTEFLESYGYNVFKIWKGFFKPILLNPNDTKNHPWEPTNYLATTDTKRALSLLQSHGWECLKNQQK